VRWCPSWALHRIKQRPRRRRETFPSPTGRVLLISLTWLLISLFTPRLFSRFAPFPLLAQQHSLHRSVLGSRRLNLQSYLLCRGVLRYFKEPSVRHAVPDTVQEDDDDVGPRVSDLPCAERRYCRAPPNADPDAPPTEYPSDRLAMCCQLLDQGKSD